MWNKFQVQPLQRLSLLVFTKSVYDRLSVETADNDGEAVL